MPFSLRLRWFFFRVHCSAWGEGVLLKLFGQPKSVLDEKVLFWAKSEKLILVVYISWVLPGGRFFIVYRRASSHRNYIDEVRKVCHQWRQRRDSSPMSKSFKKAWPPLHHWLDRGGICQALPVTKFCKLVGPVFRIIQNFHHQCQGMSEMWHCQRFHWTDNKASLKAAVVW